MNVSTMGNIARFSIVARRLFHRLEADSISDMLRSAMTQTTIITLISEIPTVANMLATEDLVLSVLVVLSVLLTVHNMDDNKFLPPT
jgi:hypothetical protein